MWIKEITLFGAGFVQIDEKSTMIKEIGYMSGLIRRSMVHADCMRWGTMLYLMIISCRLLQDMVSHMIVQLLTFISERCWCFNWDGAWYSDHSCPEWNRWSGHEGSVGDGGDDCTGCSREVDKCMYMFCLWSVLTRTTDISRLCGSSYLSQGGDCKGCVSYLVYASSGFMPGWICADCSQVRLWKSILDLGHWIDHLMGVSYH